MKPFLGARSEIVVGRPSVVESDASEYPYGVVFEDDGTTGYFYARDFMVEDVPFVDALHIYSVRGVQGPDVPSDLRIVWSHDWCKAALLLNNSPHAMFDFVEKIGYSIDEYPEPDPKTEWKHAAWNSQLKRYFYEEE